MISSASTTMPIEKVPSTPSGRSLQIAIATRGMAIRNNGIASA